MISLYRSLKCRFFGVSVGFRNLGFTRSDHGATLDHNESSGLCLLWVSAEGLRVQGIGG